MTGLRQPMLIVAIAAVALGASAAVAVRDGVPAWELRLSEWINDADGAIVDVLDPVMELGTLWAVAAAAIVVLVARRDWRLGLATAAAGLAAWTLARVVKELVERGRPAAYLSDVVVHERDATGFGFVSGHSTVAAAIAACVATALPTRLRWIPLALAALVGIGRIVHGVHLPADVIGGWALGTLLGVGALAVARVSGGQRGRYALAR